jgi:hypothetical protein
MLAMLIGPAGFKSFLFPPYLSLPGMIMIADVFPRVAQATSDWPGAPYEVGDGVGICSRVGIQIYYSHYCKAVSNVSHSFPLTWEFQLTIANL